MHDPTAADLLPRADEPWRDCAGRALAYLVANGREFTADDLTELGVPDPDHPSRWGALFAAAKARGDIIPTGYRPSTRKTRNGGYCRSWRGIPKQVAA